MIDLLNWIFSGFWHFAGSAFLISMVCYMVVVIPLESLADMYRNRCIVKINDQKLREYEMRKGAR